MKVLLCGKCKFFIPNGGVTSDSAIYAGLISPCKTATMIGCQIGE